MRERGTQAVETASHTLPWPPADPSPHASTRPEAGLAGGPARLHSGAIAGRARRRLVRDTPRVGSRRWTVPIAIADPPLQPATENGLRHPPRGRAARSPHSPDQRPEPPARSRRRAARGDSPQPNHKHCLAADPAADRRNTRTAPRPRSPRSTTSTSRNSAAPSTSSIAEAITAPGSGASSTSRNHSAAASFSKLATPQDPTSPTIHLTPEPRTATGTAARSGNLTATGVIEVIGAAYADPHPTAVTVAVSTVSAESAPRSQRRVPAGSTNLSGGREGASRPPLSREPCSPRVEAEATADSGSPAWPMIHAMTAEKSSPSARIAARSITSPPDA